MGSTHSREGAARACLKAFLASEVRPPYNKAPPGSQQVRTYIGCSFFLLCRPLSQDLKTEISGTKHEEQPLPFIKLCVLSICYMHQHRGDKLPVTRVVASC
jgi:hypothetical protein